MTASEAKPSRAFLFLQGPHGPFFDQLAKQLRETGAQCWRVGFNAGDRFFWRHRACYIPYNGGCAAWTYSLDLILEEHGITDLVLYGDTRPVHAKAIIVARQRGLRIHIFEEGYLRPYWITYERDGSNGHSRLMSMTVSDIQRMMETGQVEPAIPPGHWGDMRQHVMYGAWYHWFVLCCNRRYSKFEPHRALNVAQEFRLYLKRLTLMPLQALERMIASYRIKSGTFPYHLALLQLEHDASFQAHGTFKTQKEFLSFVISAFSKGAPQHHHLVFKAHPLEDGRASLRRNIRQFAHAHGIADRVHYVRGGKLAGLLNQARSAVTVNSTSGQQVLWRGIALHVFGAAVYNKPELVSDQPLAAFFTDPQPPDITAYRAFRDFLLATSQLPGSYYARKGRRQVIRQVTELMLSDRDPYDLQTSKSAAHRQQLRLVS